MRRQLTEVRGTVELGRPKTARSLRAVPIPARLADELALHLERYVAPGPEAFVFTSPEGGPLRRASWRSRYWLPALERAGVEPFPFHSLRRHAATAAIAAGADVKTVQALLGHSDAAVTLNSYAGLWPSALEAVAERLGEVWQAAVSGGRVVPLRRP